MNRHFVQRQADSLGIRFALRRPRGPAAWQAVSVLLDVYAEGGDVAEMAAAADVVFADGWLWDRSDLEPFSLVNYESRLMDTDSICRLRAELLLKKLYEVLEWPGPPGVVWMDSPKSAHQFVRRTFDTDGPRVATVRRSGHRLAAVQPGRLRQATMGWLRVVLGADDEGGYEPANRLGLAPHLYRPDDPNHQYRPSLVGEGLRLNVTIALHQGLPWVDRTLYSLDGSDRQRDVQPMAGNHDADNFSSLVNRVVAEVGEAASFADLERWVVARGGPRALRWVIEASTALNWWWPLSKFVVASERPHRLEPDGGRAGRSVALAEIEARYPQGITRAHWNNFQAPPPGPRDR